MTQPKERMDYVRIHHGEEWKPIPWHCLHCGRKIIAYENGKEDMKVSCDKCHTVMVRKIRGRRHDTIEIYAPRVN